MANNSLMTGVSRAFYKTGFQIKKHSPEILLVAGAIGTIASTVLACRATLKVHEVVKQTKEDVATINKSIEDKKTPAGDEYTPEDGKKDLAIVYTQTAVQAVKHFAPAVILGTLSLAALMSSHNIMRKRNMALAAAYATVDGAFKEYKKRIVERFGEELDRELKYNIKSKEIEETVVQEDGTETTVKKTVEVSEGGPCGSPYAVIYDDGCKGWTKDPELNKFFLFEVQAHANDILKSRGYLFLNELYEMLGVPKTQAGHAVGWIYDEKHPIGDNYVDLGLTDIHNERKRAFMNGYERNILIDPNVDGEIYKLVF